MAADYLKSEATCTAKAVYYKSCVCGAKGAETFEVDGLQDHVLTDVAEQPATCTVNGVKAHQHCSVCNKNFIDGAEKSDSELKIPATGHSWGAWTKADSKNHKRVCANDPSHVETEMHDWSNHDGICAVCGAKCDQAHKPGTTCEVCHKYTSYPYVPGAPTYPATAPAAPNGTVTVTPSNASKGTNVTVTVKPNEGYELGSLAVKDASGNLLPLTDLGNGKFSFVMPASKVSVEAEFVKTAATSFADVPANAYFADAVKWAVDKRITNGLSDTMFGPYESCTRAQIVTFLWRAAGSPEPKNASSFTDVPANAYYAKAVAWAVENGITNGMTETTFAPDATCTRGQSVTFLYRALKGNASGSTNFTDVKSDAFYADAINWAVANNVTNGTSNTTFSPNADCTRAEIVTFLYRAYQGK